MSFKDLTLTDSRSLDILLSREFSLLHCVPHGLGVLRLSFGVEGLSLNCLFITCSAGRMRFSRIFPSSIGQKHIPTSEGRQQLLQPIFTLGIGCLRIHCGSVMVSKFTHFGAVEYLV